MTRKKSPSWVLELPLALRTDQAKRLQAHLEAARCLYNALLGEAKKRLNRMRSDPAWQEARAIPRTRKQERSAAFLRLRKQYGFAEYALHDYAKGARCSWIADHVDSTMAQTLASRAYRAANRVCLGQAKQIRFRSKGRGMGSVEGKRNDTGMLFVLQQAEEGNQGGLLWGEDHLPALIDWKDVVVASGLRQRIKNARLVRRQASSPSGTRGRQRGPSVFRAGDRRGHPYQKAKNQPGTDTMGLDIGPSTLAVVPREGEAHLVEFCQELRPAIGKKRRLQRKMQRQHRAT